MITNTIQNELTKAKEARAQNNEGMARVCARRAAGMAAKLYWQRQGIQSLDPSAYHQLQLLQNSPGVLSHRAYQAIERLLMRVDTEFHLPDEIDLIEEAAILAEILENAP